MGAVVMPIFVWFGSRWLMRKTLFIEEGYQKSKKLVWKILSLKYKTLLIALSFMMFLFMELLWRMMFEFLIAYMQIREALVG
jgi:Mn2+/Fe2+ NRAMP family transporter